MSMSSRISNRSITSPDRFGSRPLPHITQVKLVAAAALLAAGTLGALPVYSASEAAPKLFRPSSSQWADLQVKPVQLHRFVDRIFADASVAPDEDRMTPVYSPFSGRVVRLLARPGERVAQGATLMIVEAAEIIQARSDLHSGLAAVGTARAQQELAQATERRQHELYDSDAGAYKDWQQARSDLVAADNALRSAQAGLDAARSRLRLLVQNSAQLDALERAGDPGEDRNASDAVRVPVTSPIDGVVVQRQVGVGQYIASVASGASSPVYTIGDLSRVWIVASVRETEAAAVAIGQAMEVKVAALPGRVLRARVEWVAPALDPVTRRLAVRSSLDNPDGALRSMMQAQAVIEAGHASLVPSVPASAIVFDGPAAHVWVAAADGALSLRPVRTGRSDGPWIEVTEGLAAGERVVTRGTLFLDQAAEGAN